MKKQAKNFSQNGCEKYRRLSGGSKEKTVWGKDNEPPEELWDFQRDEISLEKGQSVSVMY